ncbi:DNA polymerase-4 [Devosia enhydra]|uniref:DNA polymerase IV n=1 Tax=Devosia enhydra TaxID=665118 RepID=A0A1K2HVR6_9HYPH|nr:DNA polymerase IV [Devosia enhydra]SFZ81940.1 DNA polymerase-4 [Devosia enhydra]
MADLHFLCRDCDRWGRRETPPPRCPECGSPRLLVHSELDALAIAHIDCDAFYASIEKRDDPSLRDKPLIIGGGVRGVVSTCCYIARQYGVRSAMPMFKARELCPQATVIKPDMAKYVGVSRQIRARMDALTPSVQPLSIDEAFLDLSGTQQLHKAPPAQVLSRLSREIERDLGITVSVGLSHNKFLAKIASDLDKPRGFALIGRAETVGFLARQQVDIIFGVGKVFAEKLRRDGFHTLADIQARPQHDLIRLYGETGLRLSRLALGEDARAVETDHEMKTVSSESTFNADLADFEALSTELLALCERLSERLKTKQLAGDTVTLKLKTADFRLRTRARHLMIGTQLAGTLYQAGLQLLAREVDGTPFRLIGIGVSGLTRAEADDPADLLDPGIARRAAAERAMDRVRERFGREALVRGKLYGRRPSRPPLDKDDEPKGTPR